MHRECVSDNRVRLVYWDNSCSGAAVLFSLCLFDSYAGNINSCRSKILSGHHTRQVRIQSLHIPEDGDRDESRNVGLFRLLDAADGAVGLCREQSP